MTAPKIRVHEISKVLGVSNAEVINVLSQEFGVPVKSHSSTVEQDLADRVIARFKSGAGPAQKTNEPPQAANPAPKKSPVPPAASVTTPAPARSPESQPAQKKEPEKKVDPPVKPLPQPVRRIEPEYREPVERPRQPQPLQGQRPNQAHQPNHPSRTAGVGNPGHRPAAQTGPRPQQQGEYRSQPGGYNSQSTPRPQQTADYAQQGGQRPQSSGYRPQPGHNGPNQSPSRPQGGYGQQRPSGGGYPPSQPRPSSGGRPSVQNRPAKQSPAQRQHQERVAARLKKEEEIAAQEALPKIVTLDEPIVVRDLAIKLSMRETEIIKHLFMKGMMVTVNQTLDVDFAKTIAKELEYEVIETESVKHEGEYSHLEGEGSRKLDESKFSNLKSRSPVVSIMGHVDHGKTTLLDSIRETRHKVVDSEAGGITQSIGAYTVEKDGNRIVFLDTPGHEAFTSMRMRGAQATDIAILVVAADDGVMPQTIEAINHAKVAKIPIIVAVNKIDRADADPDRVLVQLAEYGLSAEKWGGDTLTVEVSALQKLGLDDVLDAVLLVSELLELKADATVPAEGVIIEAQLDKRMGPVATALIQNGNLKVGDNILIGSVGGRVRALIDDYGARITQAGPATPVEILGLNGVPNAGDRFQVISNDKLFKQQLASEKQKDRDQRMGVSRSVSAGFSGKSEIESDNAVKENQFNLLVKSDTQGSLEAVVEVLQRMTSDEIKINIVHSATGDISEADVMLASTAKALIIGFNSKADPNGQRLAEQEGVSIKKYDVIYHITEDIEKWVLGQLAPETEEVQVGTAEVRQIFKVGKTGIIAGCMVTSGKLLRNAKANVLRDGKEIFTGPLSNLKRFKDDVKEVASGYECGISFDKFQDLEPGDIVEVYTVKSSERTSLER